MIITKNLEDQEVINIVKSHCHDLRKVTNKKRVVIVDHPFNTNMDTFFVVTRIVGKKLWEVIYHEPHVLCNKLIINESFNIIESRSILDNYSQSVQLHQFET